MGKKETSLNKGLNNQREDIKTKNPIVADKYFQYKNHNFYRETNFTLIQQATKTFTTIAGLELYLKQ